MLPVTLLSVLLVLLVQAQLEKKGTRKVRSASGSVFLPVIGMDSTVASFEKAL